MSNKSKARRLLSRYIREIGDQAVVPIGDAGEDSGVRMATRAEALARKMWEIAEGYTEDLPDGKKKVHPPDKAMIAIIIDRMEGKVPTIDAKDQKPKASVADRVGEQSRLRMKNALVDGSDSIRST